MAVAGVEQVHASAQLVAQLEELLFLTRELLLGRECRIAEVIGLGRPYFICGPRCSATMKLLSDDVTTALVLSSRERLPVRS